MKFTRHLLTLAALAALSFNFTACDDNSSDAEEGEKTCTTADNKCVGNVAWSCNDGKMEQTTCTGTCDAGVCKDEPAGDTCTGDAAMCDGNTLKVCNGTTFVSTECADGTTCDASAKECVSSGSDTPTTCDTKCPADTAKTCVGQTTYSSCVDGCLVISQCDDGQICDNGECKNECDDSFETTCNDASSTKACDNGHFKIESCGAGMKCNAGACVEDAGAVVKADSIIGSKCSGTGTITISNKELKSAMSTTVTAMLPTLGITLEDTDVIKAPNYFENITGCDGLVAPDGMAVGCFFTDTIEFPASITGLTDKVTDILKSPFVATFLGNVDMGDINLDNMLAAIKDLLGKGIEFKADNGYCMVADIDLDISFPSTSTVGMFINSDNLSKLVDKINTPGHDHEKAKMATCPDGSTLISFGTNEESEAGTANVGFDICLKTCASDDDCRKDDGYTCVDMPRNSAEIEADTATAKVCFPSENITYFEKITEDFEKLIPED